MGEKDNRDQPLSSEELLRRAREGLLESTTADADGEPIAPPSSFDSSVTADPVESSVPVVDDVPESFTDEVWDPAADMTQSDPANFYETVPPAPEPAPEPEPEPEPEPTALSDEQLESTWSTQPTSHSPSWDPTWSPGASRDLGGGAPVGGPDPSTLPPPPKPARSSAGRFRGLFITGAILLGFFIFGALDNTTNVTALSAGDCIEDPGEVSEIGDVENVGCDAPHAFEVFAVVELTGPGTADGSSFPGEDQIYTDSFELCEPRFAPYVGTSFETSVYWIDAWTPIRDGWDDGDREALCVLYELTDDFDLKTSTFSARSSQR